MGKKGAVNECPEKKRSGSPECKRRNGREESRK